MDWSLGDFVFMGVVLAALSALVAWWFAGRDRFRGGRGLSRALPDGWIDARGAAAPES